MTQCSGGNQEEADGHNVAAVVVGVPNKQSRMADHVHVDENV